MSLVQGEDFNRLFSQFTRTARRLEVRERYNVDFEREPIRKFLAGEHDDLTWHRPWLDQIRDLTSQGKIFHRVRVVSVPLSDYNRWGLEIARHTNAAGEQIRYLARDQASDLPDIDYWLFDDTWVVRLHFDDADHPLGGEIIREDQTVKELSAALRTAESRAVSRDQFAEAHGLR